MRWRRLIGVLGLVLWASSADAQLSPLEQVRDVRFHAGVAGTATGNTFTVSGWTSIGIQVTGITTATVDFRATIDGTNYVAFPCVNASGSVVSSTTANGLFTCAIGQFKKVRAPISSHSSGTVVVTGVLSTAVARGSGGGSGSGAPTDVTYITQTADGTLSNEQALGANATGCMGSATTTGIVSSRTMTGTANEIDVTNGNCSGNPTFALSATLDLGGKTSFEVPNGAAPTTDAFGELAGDNNAWAASRGALQFYDGTANTYIIGALVSDAPANGECIKWNTGGTITWETCGSGSMATDTLWDAAGDLAYGTGSNTGGRLAIGTASQILQVNAGATAPEWTSTPSVTSLTVTGAGVGTVALLEGAAPGAHGTANTHNLYINSTGSVLETHENGGSVKTYVNLADTQTLTGKTVDCTAASNVCTVYTYRQLDLVGVSAGTAGHVWDDDPLSTTCTAASTAGTNQTRTFCTFPDSDGEYGKQLKLSLPTGYVAGSLQFRVSWKTTGTGNFRPRLQTLCYASDAASDTAYSNSTYITAAAGTLARFNQTAWTTATDTGCDAEETMAIRFSRNRTEASDTLNATADVEFVGVRYAVAQ
jgi:hypothetical protein